MSRYQLSDTSVILADANFIAAHYPEAVLLPEIPIILDPELQAIQAAQTVATKIEHLWAAADAYVTGYISGVAIGILTIGVIQQKPKCLAVSTWSGQIWAEYYNRKAGITVDSVLDLDFSSFGPMPYTVPELQAETLL